MKFIVTVEFVAENSETIGDAVNEIEHLINEGNSAYSESYPYRVLSARDAEAVVD